MVVRVRGQYQTSRTKRMTSAAMRRSWTMTAVVPWRTASGGSAAGGAAQRSSRVTVRVACFFGLPRGVRTWRSASEEWSLGGGVGGLMSGLPEPPFRRAFSSRSCWFSARRAAFSAASASMMFSSWTMTWRVAGSEMASRSMAGSCIR